MLMTIYADSTGLFTDEFEDKISNLIEVEIEECYVKQYFKHEILEIFKPDKDENVSDDGLFEEWLDEYHADETRDLWEWCNRYGIDCKISHIYALEVII